MAFNWGQSTQPSTGGFNFGSTNTQAPASTGFGFGSAPAASTGGFSFGGAPASNTASSGFGFGGGSSNLFSSQNQFSSSLSQSQPAAAPFVTGSTRFSDLPENYKSAFIEIERAIKKESNLRSEVAEKLSAPRQNANELTRSIGELNQRLSDIGVSIEKELLSISNFESIQNSEIRHCEAAIRLLNKLSSHIHQPINSVLQENIYLPSHFHWSKVEEFQCRMEELKGIMEQIEEFINANEGNMNSMMDSNRNTDFIQSGGDYSSRPKSFTSVLQSQHSALLNVSGRLARIHHGIENLKGIFIQKYGKSGIKALEKVENFIQKQEKLKENMDKNAMQIVSQLAANAANEANQANNNNANGSAIGTGAAAPASSGFGFGSSTNTTAAPSTGGFSFGAPAASSGTGGFSFGAPASTSSAPSTSGFGFGAPASTASTGFGAAAPSSSGFNFSFNNNANSASKTRTVSKPLGKK